MTTTTTEALTELVTELGALRDNCRNAQRRRAYAMAAYLAQRAADGKPVTGWGGER